MARYLWINEWDGKLLETDEKAQVFDFRTDGERDVIVDVVPNADLPVDPMRPARLIAAAILMTKPIYEDIAADVAYDVAILEKVLADPSTKPAARV